MKKMELRLFSVMLSGTTTASGHKMKRKKILFTHKKLWGLSDTETGSLRDCEASTLGDTQN